MKIKTSRKFEITPTEKTSLVMASQLCYMIKNYMKENHLPTLADAYDTQFSLEEIEAMGCFLELLAKNEFDCNFDF